METNWKHPKKEILYVNVDGQLKKFEGKEKYSVEGLYIANALTVQGRIEDAVNSCKRALGLKPNYAEGYYNLGNFLTKLDRFADAVEAYACAIALRPDYADAHYNMGNILQVHQF